MAESVILSAIESLDSWLLKKPDFFEENYEKLHGLLVDKANLCSPPFEMAEMRKDIKEKLYNMLVAKTDFGDDNNKRIYNFLSGIADFREDNMDKLHTLMTEMGDFSFHYETELYNLPRHFLLDYKKKLYQSLAGMADFTDNNKEKMKSLLIGMADFWEDNNKEKLFSLLVWVAVLPDSGLYRNKRIVNNKKKVYSLLVEMTELWEDKLDDKEKLHSLLLEITGLRVDEYMIKRYFDKEVYKRKVYSLMADIAGLCKNVKGKLRNVEVQRWLAKKAMLWEDSKLYRLLLDVEFHFENKTATKFYRNKVEGVRGELRSILDFLRGKKWEEGSSLHYFVSDAVEMAHNAQLLIEFRDSDPFIIFLIFNREDHAFIDLDGSRFVKEVDGIKNWTQETKERMLKFGDVRAITKSQNVGGCEGVVVGLEEDIKLLLGIKKHTILIRGMAGIGKTTLARLLYNHANVVDKFECRAWVCVARESSRKEILIELIRQLGDGKEFEREVGCLEKMDNEGLKQMLHQHLKGMRYFIVLDDVWEKTFLEYVLNTLPRDKGSRLLLTTRSAEIASDYRTDYDHKMKYLDDDKSWKLFLKTLFGTSTDEEFPKHLEKRGREMLARCNGLPLAIKEVGRKWAEKREMMSEWEQIVESIDLSETLAALESTYLNLDPMLKSCFLHLSFFKEGTPIRWKRLTDIWTVRGVVEEKGIYSKKFKDELEKASIIEKTPGGRRKTYRVNAVFHKLSIKKAEEEEEFGLEILRNDGKSSRVSDDPCHRVIYCSREKFIFSMNQNNSHLVSLFFHGGGYFDDSPSYWKHFEKLEILDMEDFGLKILPDAVGTLSELRYLGLRNNYIQELPRSLARLKSLEVLDIALNFTMEVPDIIWEMDSLQHLYMSDIICQKPIKMSTLENLQTLAYISADNWVCEFSGSEMLSRLRRLGIEELDMNSDISKLFASLSKLRNLGDLVLRGFRYRSMPCLDQLGALQNLYQLKLEGRLTRLPGAGDFPPEIRRLTLVNSCLDEDPMPILEKLKNLCYLKLQNAYTGRRMVISSNGFPMIYDLVIEEFWNLRVIEVAKYGMCNLQKLVDIKSCPYLETPVKDITGNHNRR